MPPLMLEVSITFTLTYTSYTTPITPTPTHIHTPKLLYLQQLAGDVIRFTLQGILKVDRSQKSTGVDKACKMHSLQGFVMHYFNTTHTFSHHILLHSCIFILIY